MSDAKSPAERLVGRRVVVPETECDDPYLATVTGSRRVQEALGTGPEPGRAAFKGCTGPGA